MRGDRDQLLKSALALAERGLRVFPLVPGEREPAVKGWPKLATTDPEMIRKVWSARAFNIGVAMGGGFIGADIDVKKGKQGFETAARYGVEPRGFVVSTPSGGRHVYFTGPDVGNSAGRLGDGLDVRGVGGFLVGPGSVVEGGAYALVEEGPFPEVPAALVHACVAPRERQQRLDVVVELDQPGSIEQAHDFLHRAPVAVEGVHGDDTTYQIAARLKDFGLSEEKTFDLMRECWNERCQPPWPFEDLKAKVRNAYEYGTSPPGIAHPTVEFANVNLGEEGPNPPETGTPSGRSWFRHGDAHGQVKWLYYNMLPLHGNTVLVAPSQAGKTFWLIELARSLATGKPFFGVEPDERGGTLFVFAGSEGSGFPHRLDALQESELLPISAASCGNLAERDALRKLLEDLKAEAARIHERFGMPVRMLVLETLSAAGMLKDENDNAEASRAMGNLAQIGRALDVLVVTSHHPDKEGKGSRGASAIPNAADCVIEIHRSGKAAVREVELFKARNAEQRKLGTFTLLPVEIGEDERGRKLVSMTVSEGGVYDGGKRASPHAPLFMQCLEWALVDESEEIDGVRCVELDFVRELFKAKKEGSRDRSNMSKAFKAAMDYCESVGAIETIPSMGRVYITKRDLGDDDD